MSHRFSHTSPAHLVKLALGLAAALATMFALMAATSSPAQADGGTCSPSLVCVTDITVKDLVNVKITGNKILDGNQIGVVKVEVEKVLNNSVNCNQILNIGLTAGCKSDIITAVANITKSFNGVNVLGIQVIKL
jgi:hypothetical protein